MKLFLKRFQKSLIVFFHDFMMICLAWFGAYWLRFNLDIIPEPYLHHAIKNLPIVIIVQVVAYIGFGLYRGVWRFASMPDLLRIIKAVAIGAVIASMSIFLHNRLYLIPRSVFPLYALLLIILLGGSRFIYRWLKDHSVVANGKRVLIVGAGQAGEGIARDLLRHKNMEYIPIAFVDDNPAKKGQEIHGIRVLGKCDEIPQIVKRYAVELIIIAMPSVGSADMRRLMGYCEQAQVPVRTLPGINDLANGVVKIESIREVSIDDLLGRDPVTLDWEAIKKDIENKVILISGGGGSIGSELCRQIAQLNPKQLIIAEQNEFNLYTLELELQQKYTELNFTGLLIDITDQAAVNQIMQEYSLDIVFHAAAYKHVPMLEYQLRAAVRNNILGTFFIAKAAAHYHVKKFILISTDKAVNPTNIMGATKRAAEIICQNYNKHSDTQFITVRFGNVLGSAGSVVPLFRKQISAGGPVTVTHPEITRFFMTIPEASQLILQAMVIGNGGEIFVLDMGDPIKIRYLAEQMILLSGLVPGKDIEIQYTGLRPGEKLFEELFHENEKLMTTRHAKILQARYRDMSWEWLLNILDGMQAACEKNNEKELLNLLCNLVSDYQGQDSNARLKLIKATS